MFNFSIKDCPDEENPEAIDINTYSLKGMNCPGHCLIFSSTKRSYKELPMRLADFGVLHRNEAHGALTGLTRVRRFCQDDSHIFCTEEQVSDEINNCLDFLKYVYGIFGLKFHLALSTRPDSYTGTIEIWNRAEDQLQSALYASGLDWKLNPGDGAFYGPKIDISIQDAIGRNHQCATIQLDFNLPERFNLSYQKANDTEARPVIIHRAILGSVERMIAILTEHYQGEWPFWLSPRQISIVPVSPKFYEYANKVRDIYHTAGFNVELDTSADTLKKKIVNAEIEGFNFIFVVGAKEQTDNTVNVRTRQRKILGTFSHEDVIASMNDIKLIN